MDEGITLHQNETSDDKGEESNRPMERTKAVRATGSQGMMSPSVRRNYDKFRKAGGGGIVGFSAVGALSRARTLEAWKAAEDQGFVRLTAEPEHESYFDVYGEPETEEERKRIVDEINLHGCYCVVGYYCVDGTEDGPWVHGDSIGMSIYSDPLDPFENCYVTDIMQTTLDALAVAIEEPIRAAAVASAEAARMLALEEVVSAARAALDEIPEGFVTEAVSRLRRAVEIVEKIPQVKEAPAR